MSTCNRLDLQTLRSQPIMPKNLPDHRVGCVYIRKVMPQSKDRYKFWLAGWRPSPVDKMRAFNHMHALMHFFPEQQSPTLGAHTHAYPYPYPWVLGGHGWASVLCIPTSNFKSESNFSDVGNTLTKKPSGLKPMTVNDFLFVRSNQDLVYAGNTHYTIFEYMGAI